MAAMSRCTVTAVDCSLCDRVIAVLQLWQEARYDRATGACIAGESGVVNLLEATVCGRLNGVFAKQGIDYRFVNTRIRPSDSQGQAWDWSARSYWALDQDLRKALARIHKAGVMHGGVHKSNILVTPADRVIILDFAASQMHADPKQMAAEMSDLTELQAVPVDLHP